eukprot:scaffold179184_cov32-Tisochrysis_lutea.AAC.2
MAVPPCPGILPSAAHTCGQARGAPAGRARVCHETRGCTPRRAPATPGSGRCCRALGCRTARGCSCRRQAECARLERQAERARRGRQAERARLERH